jgi:uncharacterized protein (TIGR02246 family)
MNHEEKAIAKVLVEYGTALGASQTDTVLKLYAPDGVFMPQNSPASVGHEAVRKAYDQLFQNVRLTATFEIAEIHQIAPDWAFARTNSTATVFIHANGATIPDANHELFVFQKVANEWKIARYCFSTINPARG